MVCIKIPTLQNEMQVFLSLTFRYLTCLLDKGHIIEAGGFFCVNSAKPFLFLVLKINSCYDKN